MRDKDEAAAREEKLINANIMGSEALNNVTNTIIESNKINRELSETNRLIVEKVEETLEDISESIGLIIQKLS